MEMGNNILGSKWGKISFLPSNFVIIRYFVVREKSRFIWVWGGGVGYQFLKRRGNMIFEPIFEPLKLFQRWRCPKKMKVYSSERKKSIARFIYIYIF